LILALVLGGLVALVLLLLAIYGYRVRSNKSNQLVAREGKHEAIRESADVEMGTVAKEGKTNTSHNDQRDRDNSRESVESYESDESSLSSLHGM
jgi:hypothetical protein